MSTGILRFLTGAALILALLFGVGASAPNSQIKIRDCNTYFHVNEISLFDVRRFSENARLWKLDSNGVNLFVSAPGKMTWLRESQNQIQFSFQEPNEELIAVIPYSNSKLDFHLFTRSKKGWGYYQLRFGALGISPALSWKWNKEGAFGIGKATEVSPLVDVVTQQGWVYLLFNLHLLIIRETDLQIVKDKFESMRLPFVNSAGSPGERGVGLFAKDAGEIVIFSRGRSSPKATYTVSGITPHYSGYWSFLFDMDLYGASYMNPLLSRSIAQGRGLKVLSYAYPNALNQIIRGYSRDQNLKSLPGFATGFDSLDLDHLDSAIAVVTLHRAGTFLYQGREVPICRISGPLLETAIENGNEAEEKKTIIIYQIDQDGWLKKKTLTPII